MPAPSNSSNTSLRAARCSAPCPRRRPSIAERFFDESGGMQLVIHAPFGGRINKAWGLALRKRFCRSFNFELQAAATDNGLNISLAEQHSFPLRGRVQFPAPRLAEAGARTGRAGLRLCSQRAGAGTRAARSRCSAFRAANACPRIFSACARTICSPSVFPEALACQENIEGEIEIPDHPLIREVMKDVLTEAMDIDGLERVLGDIARGEIRCVAVDTPIPSQFSHEILNANPYAYLDDAPLEERRARAVEMRRVLPESVLSEVGTARPGRDRRGPRRCVAGCPRRARNCTTRC